MNIDCENGLPLFTKCPPPPPPSDITIVGTSTVEIVVLVLLMVGVPFIGGVIVGFGWGLMY